MGLLAAWLALSPLPSPSGPQGPKCQSGLESRKRPIDRAGKMEGGGREGKPECHGLDAARVPGWGLCRSPALPQGPAMPPGSPQTRWSLQRGLPTEEVSCELLKPHSWHQCHSALRK